MLADLLAVPVLGVIPWGVVAAILVAGLFVLALSFYLTGGYRTTVVTAKPQAAGLASDRREIALRSLAEWRTQRDSSIGSDVPGGGAW